MSAVPKYLPFHQPTGLGETQAPANDNCHLHLIHNPPPVDPEPEPEPPLGSGTGTDPVVGYVPDMDMVFASGMIYHPSGSLAAMTYGNDQEFSQTLTPRLQPLHVRSALGASVGTSVALDMTYIYDPRGKVASVVNGAISGDDRAYNYDALGRLISATGPWGAGHSTGSASYVYDAMGNMRSKTVGPRNLAMSYDSQNRLTSHTDNVGSGRSLGYDARGNVTQLGSLFFTYDMSDQPTYISGSANGTYRYDGNLKRVKSVVDGQTIYNIFDAGGTLIHIDAVTSGKQTDYIGKVARVTNSADLTGSSIDEVTYLHADQLGSANTGSDENGNVLWREQYTPFGITLTSPLVNNDLAGFTGHIKDSATGLNYMQARYYDPLIGRFLSRDPIGFSPERPEMFSSYTYVNNDPINANDPDGEFLNFVVGAAIGLAAEAYSIKKSGGKIFDKANAGRFAKAGAIGAISGGLGGAVAKGGAKIALSQVGKIGGQVTAKVGTGALAGGTAGATAETLTQAVEGEFNGGDIAKAGAVGALLGGVAGGAQGVAQKAGAAANGANRNVASTFDGGSRGFSGGAQVPGAGEKLGAAVGTGVNLGAAAAQTEQQTTCTDDKC